MYKYASRIVALLLVPCLITEPSAAQLRVQRGSFSTSELGTLNPEFFSRQALAVTPAGSRFPRLLEKSDRLFENLRAMGQSLQNWFHGEILVPQGVLAGAGAGGPQVGLQAPFRQENLTPRSSGGDLSQPSSARAAEQDAELKKYRAEHGRLQAELEPLTRNGLTVPAESFTLKAYDDEKRSQPYGFFGIFGIPPPLVAVELSSMQKRFMDLLVEIVPTEAQYKELMRGLIIPNADLFHLTFGSFDGGPDFIPEGPQFWKERFLALRRMREIAQFRRTMDLQFKGQLAFFQRPTPSIAAVLDPIDAVNLSRYQTFKSAVASRLKVRSEQAHVTLVYVRGLRQPDGSYRLSPQQMQWLAEAMARLEAEKKPLLENPMPSLVTELKPAVAKHADEMEFLPAVPLLSREKYEELIAEGRRRLAEAWGLSDPSELDGRDSDRILRRDKLDAVRGLFSQYHLRNVRALMVAIGSGAIRPGAILRMIRHGQRLNVREEWGQHAIRVRAHYDNPGLLLAISRVLDQSAGIIETIDKSYMRRTDDPSDTRQAFTFNIPNMSAEDFQKIATSIELIPDIGHPIRLWGWIKRWAQSLVNRWRGTTLIKVRITIPERDGTPGEESRRTRLLQALSDLDPHNNVIEFSEVRQNGNDIITTTLEVPKNVAARVPGQLAVVLGLETEEVKLLAPIGRAMTDESGVDLPPLADISVDSKVPDVEITPEHLAGIRTLFAQEAPATQRERLHKVAQALHLNRSLPSDTMVADSLAALWATLRADEKAMSRFEKDVLNNPANASGFTIRFAKGRALNGAQSAWYLLDPLMGEVPTSLVKYAGPEVAAVPEPVSQGKSFMDDEWLEFTSNLGIDPDEVIFTEPAIDEPKPQIPLNARQRELLDLIVHDDQWLSSADVFLADHHRAQVTGALDLSKGPSSILTQLDTYLKLIKYHFDNSSPYLPQIEQQEAHLRNVAQWGSEYVDAGYTRLRNIAERMIVLTEAWAAGDSLIFEERRALAYNGLWRSDATTEQRLVMLSLADARLRALTELPAQMSFAERRDVLAEYLRRDAAAERHWLEHGQASMEKGVENWRTRIQEKMYEILQPLMEAEPAAPGRPVIVVDGSFWQGTQRVASVLTGDDGVAPHLTDTAETLRGQLLAERIWVHEAAHRKTAWSLEHPMLEERRVMDVEEDISAGTRKFFDEQIDARHGRIGTIEFLLNQLRLLDPDLYNTVNAARRYRVYRGERLKDEEPTKGHLVRRLYSRISSHGFAMTEGSPVAPSPSFLWRAMRMILVSVTPLVYFSLAVLRIAGWAVDMVSDRGDFQKLQLEQRLYHQAA